MKLFIFGSTGDLVKRKVFPDLHHLNVSEVIAIGRRNLEKQEYQELSCKECHIKFKEKLTYVKLDFESDFKELEKHLDKDKINHFYISMPPKLLINILKGLIKLKQRKYKLKILIEKPFGENLNQAKQLEKLVKQNNLNIYLSDHYLFKQNIINLEKQEFKKIKIVSLEKLGLENRKYYDDVGALKDMIQSHFLNIIFKLYSLNNPKVKEFRLGQYKEYEREIGTKSNTETCAYLVLEQDNKEFELITAKAYDKKESYIQIDDKKIELDSGKEYTRIFHDFINNKKHNFPTIKQALTSWRIITNIEKQKPKLKYYPKNQSTNLFTA